MIALAGSTPHCATPLLPFPDAVTLSHATIDADELDVISGEVVQGLAGRELRRSPNEDQVRTFARRQRSDPLIEPEPAHRADRAVRGGAVRA